MPAFGFGTFELKAINESIREAFKFAVDVGYRLIDTAPTYLTQRFVGEAIRDRIAAGVVKREDLFIVSKLWNTNHKFDKVVPACRKSLEALGLDHVDLYLINWPIWITGRTKVRVGECIKVVSGSTGEVDYTDTWRGMEDLV